MGLWAVRLGYVTETIGREGLEERYTEPRQIGDMIKRDIHRVIQRKFGAAHNILNSLTCCT